MFKLVRLQELKEYEGQGLFYRDDRTGMEVFHIKNKSAELSCCFMFQTPSEDSKGVAHILEHTVLCGSERFPVKDPFSQVLLSSTNTFLNAMTFCDKTLYPFASPLKKDFDILFGIYSDAVFAPLLRRESFMQEGIRCFGDKFDGVVFNEMTGALSTEESLMENASTASLYRGTPYEFESGGDPLWITDLTYEEYLKRYRKWYSPSNCRLFLFGDLDAFEYMDRIEKLYFQDLSRWDGIKLENLSADYTNIGLTPGKTKVKCGTDGVCSTVVSWLTQPSDDCVQVMTLSLLVEILLGNPGAPLYRAITESGLGEDLHPISGMETELPVMTFTVGFTGVKPDSEEKIESFLLSQFESYVKDGLPTGDVEAAIKRQEFTVQEIPGSGTPFGLLTALKASRTWLRGGRPEDGINVVDTLEKVKKLSSQGRYFEQWIEKNILNNSRRSCITVEYDSLYSQSRQTALDTKLKMIQSDTSVDWITLKTSFDAFVQTPDSQEALATIERITREDLPQDIPDFKHEKHETGKAEVFCFRQFCRGIAYVNISFDTLDLSLEEKRIIPVLMRILQMCGTSESDYSETGTKLKFLTGGFEPSFLGGRRPDGSPVSVMVIRTKMLIRDYSEALALIGDILLDGDVADPERIKSTITDIITEFDSTFVDYGSAFASLSSASALSPTVWEHDIAMGFACYSYLSNLRTECDDNWESLSEKLLELRNKIFVQSRMKFHLSSDDGSINELAALSDSFIERFPEGYCNGPSEFYEMKSPLSPRRALSVSEAPAFNAMTIPLDNTDERTLMGCNLLLTNMSHNCLWDTVRGKGGAYGVESHLDIQEHFAMFSSYRDPGIEQTYKAFEEALLLVPDSVSIEYSVVAIVGKQLKPLAPRDKSREDFRRILFALDTGILLRRRHELLDIKPCDYDGILSFIRKNLEKASIVTVCGLSMADSLKDFENIRVPL